MKSFMVSSQREVGRVERLMRLFGSLARYPLGDPRYFSSGFRQAGDLGLALGELEVGLDHDLHEFLELHLGLPAELLLRLGRVADQQLDLGGTLVAGVVLDVLLPVEVQQAEGLLT
jgi:hypothetical protein